jgi:type IV pilus assembly protein PilM
VDVGSTAVRVAEVAAGDIPVVVRAAQVPLPPGVVEAGEVRQPEAVAEALREVWSKSGVKSKQVHLGVGNQRVVVREVALPWLPEKELRDTLGFQVQEFIPMASDEAVLDFDPLGEMNQGGRRMVRILLVAAHRPMVNALVEAALAAKLDPQGIDLTPFAVVRAVGTGDEGLDLDSSGDEAIVDIGAQVTSICVHDRGVTRFVRMLPSGGRDITLALAAGLSVDEDGAERLKRGESIEAPTQVEPSAGEPAIELPPPADSLPVDGPPVDTMPVEAPRGVPAALPDPTEVGRDVEVLERADDVELARAVHRVVDLGVRRQAIERADHPVGPRLDPHHMALIEDHHRLLVLRRAGRAGGLVRPEHGFDVRRQVCAELGQLGEPEPDIRRRALDDERGDPVRLGDGVGHAEHPAPRMPEDVAARQPERLPNGIDLFDVELGRPHRGIMRLGDARVPTPELIVEDDAAALGQGSVRFHVMPGRAGPAM